MPLNPFHDTCARPPARGVWCRLLVHVQSTESKQRFSCTNLPGDSDLFPVRRPSAGVAQGDARHGRRARNDGTGTSRRDGPRSGAGARGVRPRSGRTRMPGWPSFFGYFFLARQEKVTRRARRNLSFGPRKARRACTRTRAYTRTKAKSFAVQIAPTGAPAFLLKDRVNAIRHKHPPQRLSNEAAPAPPNSAALTRLNQACPCPVRR